MKMRDEEGIKIGGVDLNNIKYADDTVMMADSEEKLQLLVDSERIAGDLRGLLINASKIEVIVVSKNPEE